jgi:ferredoxin-type protein NapF
VKYGIMACFAVALIVGISLITGLLEPFSVFGRIMSQIFRPIYLAANNVLAFFAEKNNSFTFYRMEIWISSVTVFIITIINLLIIAFLAIKKGGFYCNILCPVGTFLGLVNKISPFKMSKKIASEKCVKCNICERKCMSNCIDLNTQNIEEEFCLNCYACLKVCPTDAINLSFNKQNKPTNEKPDDSRRSFISKISLLALAIFSTQKISAYDFDGGLAPIEKKLAPRRHTRITPPGSISHRHFDKYCTACQLCISVCPNNVLRPSTNLKNFMQPVVSYEKGYCRPECVNCSQVCPTGAIREITREEKAALQIGYAIFNSENCVMVTQSVNCDRCSTKCPTGAITLIEQTASNGNVYKLPTIEKERCIGCGACEQLCPARPFSAIFVNGVDRQREI